MAFRGAVGIITSFPNHNEKHCVGCEHWKGERDITYGGTAATRKTANKLSAKWKRIILHLSLVALI